MILFLCYYYCYCFVCMCSVYNMETIDLLYNILLSAESFPLCFISRFIYLLLIFKFFKGSFISRFYCNQVKQFLVFAKLECGIFSCNFLHFCFQWCLYRMVCIYWSESTPWFSWFTLFHQL